jgi:type IV pilus assembly protein PilA
MCAVIQRLNDRRQNMGDEAEDAGFTLIELMVVLLILAILLAIAIPTFLGVTGGANDRAAQSNLNTGLTTAKSAATQNNQLYVDPSATPAQTAATQLAVLQSNEPSLKFVSGPTNVQGQISVYYDTNGQGIVLASPSKNGPKCWYAVDNLVALTAAAGNGAYGATTDATGTATTAPSGAGTWYSSGTQTSAGGNCAANVAPIGASAWKSNGF